jgi:hypothetical protein
MALSEVIDLVAVRNSRFGDKKTLEADIKYIAEIAPQMYFNIRTVGAGRRAKLVLCIDKNISGSKILKVISNMRSQMGLFGVTNASKARAKKKRRTSSMYTTLDSNPYR